MWLNSNNTSREYNNFARKSSNRARKKPRTGPRNIQKLRKSINTKKLKQHPRKSKKQINRMRTKAQMRENLPVASTMIKTKSRANNILNTEHKEKFRNIELSNSELINFTAMIYAEANNQWPRGQAAVGYTILNRMRFWNMEMNKVLFAPNQFSPVRDGNFARAKGKITKQHVDFARKILRGEIPNPIGKATFFQTIGADRQRGSWQRSARTLTRPVVVGHHIFRTEKRFA